MTTTVTAKRFRDLLRLFDALAELNERLFVLLGSKIDAMKRADLAAMRGCGEGERELVEQLQQREGLRRQLMDAIGEELGLSSRAARLLTVTQLASRISEPQRAALLKAADLVRKAVLKVAQANRVVGTVSREVLNHLKWVFASVRPRDEKPAGYAGDGVLVTSSGAAMFEMVG